MTYGFKFSRVDFVSSGVEINKATHVGSDIVQTIKNCLKELMGSDTPDSFMTVRFTNDTAVAFTKKNGRLKACISGVMKNHTIVSDIDTVVETTCVLCHTDLN